MTKQTQVVDATLYDFRDQARRVLTWALGRGPSDALKAIHFNFMARGEPLANPNLQRRGWRGLVSRLDDEVDGLVQVKYLISTILPQSIRQKRLVDIFPKDYPEIYYSLYSMSEKFRKHWMPQALPVAEGLDKLREWQEDTNKIPTIHMAFLEGHNATSNDVDRICHAVQDRKLRVNVNIVRYNQQSEALPIEPTPEKLHVLARAYRVNMPFARVKIVDRVGEDVFASCGCFVPKESL